MLDGWNGVAHHHLAQNVDVAIVAAADPASLRDARSRGRDQLRLLSCGANTFKYDLRSEDRQGKQDSTVSVFTRDGNGMLHHFYTAPPSMAQGINQRGLDLLCPAYTILDLTPQGRDDLYASFDYGPKLAAARN